MTTLVAPSSESIAEVRMQARIEWARRCAADKDIMGWGRALFPHKFPLGFCQSIHQHFVNSRHHPFTNDEAPRGTAKTTFKCFLIPIFQAIEEPETFKHYLNVQATEDKALAVNRSIKHELDHNEILLRMHGDLRGARWTDGQFVLQTGVVFSCLGAGQSIRGLNYLNVRPDFVIADDLYDREDINNYESTRRKTDWFWSDLFPALSQHGRTCIHVQGTAINKADLLEELKSKPSVKSTTFKTIIDMIKGIVVWPEQKSFIEVIAQRDKMPLTIWEREFQNTRRDDSISIIKQAWLAGWEYDAVELHRKIESKESIVLGAAYIGNDPSIGKKEENDSSGFALVLKTRRADDPQGTEFWIEDLANDRLSLRARIETLRGMSARRAACVPTPTARIEAISGFNDYADEVAALTDLPVERVDHVPDKITNLENKSIHFQNGRVHINSRIPEALRKLLEEQLTNNHPDHDDLRDAVFLGMGESERPAAAFSGASEVKRRKGIW